MSWVLKMAWRDARQQSKKLFLCMLSIVCGVAALVAINSFGHNLQTAIDQEADTLLGADLLIRSPRPFSKKAEALFDQLGGERSRETRFMSMAAFPESGHSRMVAVRALEGGFPYYGELLTEPPGVDLQEQSEPTALIDESVMLQFGLEVGDIVTLGQVDFQIAGQIKKIPGEGSFSGVFAPRLYIPLQYLEETGLVGFGSVINYRIYFQLPEGVDEKPLKQTFLAEEQLRYETVETRKKNLGRSLENIYSFLRLVGFVALLLGAIGVAGAIHIYLKDKAESVALLRCLGVTSGRTFAVYWLQVVCVAIGGSLLGAVLGVAVQGLLPLLLGAFLPFELDNFISWPSIAISVFASFWIAFLFSLVPLLELRQVTPLRALRASVETNSERDFWVWGVYGVLALSLLGFCVWQAAVWWQGLAFAAGLSVAYGVFYGMAVLLRASLKQLPLERASFVWKQSVKNLYRPNNRTIYLITTLGMGVFLVYTLFLVKHTLLSQSELTENQSEPNLMFFDIQWDQLEGVTEIIESEGLSIIDQAPVVTMRLAELKGDPVELLRMDANSKIPRWVLNREWRSTFRATLKEETEEIIAGEFIPRWDALKEPVPISMEEGMAKDLQVGLGDEILFDVQGIPLRTEVRSIRKVDWQRMRSNFFTVFPSGVLEDAPLWHITFLRSPDVDTTAQLQRKVVSAYPNVTAVDLRLILDALKSVLDRVSYILQFMGSFTLVTGLIVLAGTVITSRYQRMREAVLLRTLGGTRKTILRIMAIEYLFLGLLAAFVAALLALISGWALAHFVFKASVIIPWLSVPVVLLSIPLITVIVGLANSRGIASRSPLEILRETG